MTREELSKLIKESAEKKPIDDISSYNQGFVDGAGFAMDKIRGIVDKEPGKESITLQELADWLRGGIIFDYLTARKQGDSIFVTLWKSRDGLAPEYYLGAWLPFAGGVDTVASLNKQYLIADLDLSEYQDENGEIDYGKCIIKCR